MAFALPRFFYRRGYHCWFFSVLKKRPSVRAVAWDGLFMGLSAVFAEGRVLIRIRSLQVVLVSYVIANMVAYAVALSLSLRFRCGAAVHMLEAVKRCCSGF